MPPESDRGELLDFFHVCPIGLISFGSDGRVSLANPEAANLLVPRLGAGALTNLAEALTVVWPEFGDLLRSDRPAGKLVEHHRIRFDDPVDDDHWLAFTVVRRSGNGGADHVVMVEDVSVATIAQTRTKRALRRERAGRQRLELLQRNAVHLASASSVDELARSVLSDLKEAIGVEVATVNVVDDEGGVAGVRVIPSPSLVPEVERLGVERASQYLRGELDEPLPGPQAIRTGTDVQVDSLAELRERFPFVAEVLAPHGVESLLATPMRTSDGAVLGSLVVCAAEEHWFDRETRRLIVGIASQTGLAIERARLADDLLEAQEREHAIATRLQEALLPSGPVEHPAVSISASYRAAADLMAVGGDWYDSYVWPDGRVGIVVGDVVGHDLDAAAAMGQLRWATSGVVPLAESRPGAVLDALSHCARSARSTRYATAACVVIDPDDGRLSWSTAGHPPPLLIGPDGSTTWLDRANSTPIGLTGATDRTERTVDLVPGSVVVVYSDGLIERRGEAIDVGLDRLRTVAAQVIGGNDCGVHAGEVSDRLIDAMTAGTTLRDDVVVLVARWRPAGTSDRRD